jgi:hypothetical protein
MTKSWRLASIVFASLLAATPGCVRAQARAKASPPPPPLAVPPPPPRVVEPTDAEMPAPVGLVGDQERTPPARPRATTPPAPRPEPKPEAARPEAAPPETAKPTEEPRQPPTTLQTTPTLREGEVEARIRAQLNKAIADLGRVNRQTLGANAKTQYDTARGFVKQADDALKAKNLLFAGSLADKAAALAAQLAGR